MTTKKQQIKPHQFKGIDDFLDGQSSENIGTEVVSIDQIQLPKNQPRRYFDEQAMQELTVSVRQYGILQPLLVRTISSETYELVAGERRYRAAQEAALEEVPVIIKELSDNEALEVAILENLQRQDLNPVEETEAILDLLSTKLTQPREAVISLLNQASHINLATADNVIRSSDWKLIESIFESIGRFTPESFRSNRLPLLKLSEDVLTALRKGNIQYTKAREIAKVKDDQKRQGLMEDVVSNGLALSEIKERVKELKGSEGPKLTKKAQSLIQRIVNIQSKAKKANIWRDKDKVQRVEALLSELESFIDEGG